MISGLFGYDVLLREILIALIGHSRVLHIRDRLSKIRLRLPKARKGLRYISVCLLQLLVNLRSIDFGQQLSRAHAVANVHMKLS